MTVSRVINTPDRVSPATTARVRDAIERLGYVPAPVSGGSSRRSRTVAAVVPTLAHPMFAGVVQAFNDQMRRAGYQVMVSIRGHADADDDALFRGVLRQRPDGLLITGSGYGPATWQLLTEARIPIVEAWTVSSRPTDMVISLDHARVGAAVADFLVGKGHERLALLHSEESDALTRARGFAEAVAKAGHAVVADFVTPAPGTIAGGRDGLRKLLPLLDRRCAVFCDSDLLAFGVLTEAGVRGVPVPERLAVCGFGNFELGAMNEPPITTVSLDDAGTGRLAASFLLRRLGGEGEGDAARVQAPCRIVPRATT